MTITLILVLSAAFGYLLGSIPFGLVLTRMAGLGDIRKIGSGNIGATNVLRTGRKDLAILTLLLDAFKAGIAAFIAVKIVPANVISICDTPTSLNIIASLIAGTFGVLGHIYPVWLKFKGGKGVAAAFGFVLMTNWIVALLALGSWLIVVFTTKYSSLSALTALVLVPVYTYLFGNKVEAIFYIPIVMLIIALHHENIKRLIKGTESKVSLKKSK